MPCGHDVMLDQPEELAEELLALSQRSIAPARRLAKLAQGR
jgi:hypothetical protein